MSRFFLCIFFLFGATGLKENNSPLQDAVKRSESLLLQKQRKLAVDLLHVFFQKEALSEKEKEILNKHLDYISSAFLTEKGQQLFEVGMSLIYQDMAQAEQKLKEAQAVEVGQIDIQTALVRIELRGSKCDAAVDGFKAIHLAHRQREEVVLLADQIDLCYENNRSPNKTKFFYETQRKSFEENKKLGPFFLLNKIERSMTNKDPAKAQELVLLFDKLRRQKGTKEGAWENPEVLFWDYKSRAALGPASPKENLDLLEKYLAKCKNLTSAQKRSLSLDPNLCTRRPEAEETIRRYGGLD